MTITARRWRRRRWASNHYLVPLLCSTVFVSCSVTLQSFCHVAVVDAYASVGGIVARRQRPVASFVVVRQDAAGGSGVLIRHYERPMMRSKCGGETRARLRRNTMSGLCSVREWLTPAPTRKRGIVPMGSGDDSVDVDVSTSNTAFPDTSSAGRGGCKPLLAVAAGAVLLLATTATTAPSAHWQYWLKAIACTMVSTVAGLTVEERFSSWADLGIIVTLLSSAALSNAGVVPSSHPLYDLCWTKFLPASLALLLLSSSPPPSSSSSLSSSSSSPTGGGEDSPSGSDDGIGVAKITAVSIPFFIGSVGSVLGCATSFLLSLLIQNHTTAHHHTSSPPFVASLGRLLGMTDLTDAAIAAGCLCASYIGGSVNFFATARILDGASTAARWNGGVSGGRCSSNRSSLYGAMAGADVFLMAIYFAGLTAMKRSTVLWSWFPGRRMGGGGGRDVEAATVVVGSSSGDDVRSAGGEKKEGGATEPISGGAASASCVGTTTAHRTPGERWRERRKVALASVYVGTLAWIIVEMSTSFERGLSLPGAACACIALLSSTWNVLQRRFVPQSIVKRADTVAKPMSNVCFHLLFASIGFSANVRETLMRHGPSCVFFAGLALAIHVAFLLLGSTAVMKLFPKCKSFPLGLDEVMVASNAAIGGRATAAAFAGSFDGGNRRGLVMSATVWGVFGYGIGTGVGVALTKWLLGLA